jgi:pimeloyl-ACP methyl ester carboxylesterase
MDFALVHGSYHGAWCWDLLIPELERRGHRVVAVNLPISDPAAAASEYAAAVVAAIDGIVDPIVVGHSMAGVVIPIVAERRPVSRLVFLAAMLPIPGRSVNEQRATEPIDVPVELATAEWTDLGDEVWMVGPRTATELFFPDAPPDVAAWAASRLRPQCYRVMSEPSPLLAPPAAERSFIVCREDRALNPGWARAAARERLGIEAVEIDGSHSPFLTRPAELADMLDEIARSG